MAMTVQLESPPGAPVLDKVVSPGSLIRFQIYVSGVFGAPEPFVPVHAQLSGPFNIKVDGVTSLAGNAALDMQLPVGVSGQPTATIWHDYLLLIGDDKQSFSMGVGEAPAPNPTPGNWWDSLVTILPWAALIIGAGYLINSARKK